jgi:hypothetical protein
MAPQVRLSSQPRSRPGLSIFFLDPIIQSVLDAGGTVARAATTES